MQSEPVIGEKEEPEEVVVESKTGKIKLKIRYKGGAK